MVWNLHSVHMSDHARPLLKIAGVQVVLVGVFQPQPQLAR